MDVVRQNLITMMTFFISPSLGSRIYGLADWGGSQLLEIGIEEIKWTWQICCNSALCRQCSRRFLLSIQTLSHCQESSMFLRNIYIIHDFDKQILCCIAWSVSCPMRCAIGASHSSRLPRKETLGGFSRIHCCNKMLWVGGEAWSLRSRQGSHENIRLPPQTEVCHAQNGYLQCFGPFLQMKLPKSSFREAFCQNHNTTDDDDSQEQLA